MFYNNMTQSTYDIIGLTETFLTSSVTDGELFPPGYVVIRKDRVGDAGWGGVLLAVRNCYSVRMITDVDGLTPDKELLFAIIKSINIKLLCCVVYLPPNCTVEHYLSTLTCIENAVCSHPELALLVLGDFNLNSFSNNVKTQFDFFCEFCKLKDHNSVFNINGGKLDLILSDLNSDQVDVSFCIEPLVPIDKYHPSLEVVVKLQRNAGPPLSQPRTCQQQSRSADWNWHKADFQMLYASLAEIDWSDLLEIDDIDRAVELFYLKLYESFDHFVPVKNSNQREQRYVYPKWYTSEIISNLRYKYYHLKKYKAEGKEFNQELYKFYRWHTKILIDNAYKQHIDGIQKSIVDEPAKFWGYVRDKKKDRRCINHFSYDGVEVSGQAAADAFSRYFSSVFQANVPRLDSMEAASAGHSRVDVKNITINDVSEADFKAAVKRLKSKTARGPDGVPVFLAKDCESVICTPLLYIYNLCLNASKYPACWKLSRVTPVPKGDAKGDIRQYRPVPNIM